MATADVTAQRLRDLFNYDPGTGVFIRRINCWKMKAGSIAGCMNHDGYLRICIDRRSYQAHRLAWVYMTGSHPNDEIDHINGVRSDNRWANLRDVSRSVNQQNEKKARSSNVSGHLGVHFDPRANRYQAAIRIDGAIKHIGMFATADLAHAAYLKAKRVLHPGCTI